MLCERRAGLAGRTWSGSASTLSFRRRAKSPPTPRSCCMRVSGRDWLFSLTPGNHWRARCQRCHGYQSSSCSSENGLSLSHLSRSTTSGWRLDPILFFVVVNSKTASLAAGQFLYQSRRARIGGGGAGFWSAQCHFSASVACRWVAPSHARWAARREVVHLHVLPALRWHGPSSGSKQSRHIIRVSFCRFQMLCHKDPEWTL